LEKEVS